MPAPPIAKTTLAVRVSADGLAWSTAVFPFVGYANVYPSQLYDIEFGNGRFVAAAMVEQHFGPGQDHPTLLFFWSSDGTNWNTGATAIDPFIPTYFGHRFLSYANGMFYEFTAENPAVEKVNRIVLTTDGSSLAAPVIQAPAEAYDTTAMISGNGRFVMTAAAGKIWGSSDGVSWSPSYSGDRDSIAELVRGQGYYIGAGNGSGTTPFIASHDGLSFAPISDVSDNCWAICFDGSNYVAVGGSLYSSTNGFDWVQRSSNTFGTLYSICRGASRWVAVGFKGTIITSPNTLAWTLRSSGTANSLSGVAFGNDLYVAVGDAGTIVTSTDGGVTWDAQFSGTANSLRGVRFINGKFIAVGDNGTILCSTNATDWQSLSAPTSAFLSDIAFGNGLYCICGSSGTLLQSTNGTNWEDISLDVPASTGFNRISYMEGSFWIVGDDGTILQSDSADGLPHLTGIKLPAQDGFQIRIVLNAPPSYRIQAATNLNLNLWEDIAIIGNRASPFAWTDTNNLNIPLKLYRIVSP